MMQAGKYYVGDLCYVLDDDEWDQVCSIIIQGNKVIDGEFVLEDGREFAIYSTAYGDGEYNDYYGNSYSVDSGSIGCIKIEDIKNVKDKIDIKLLGATVDFEIDFVTGGGRGTKDWDGIIQFGRIAIETDSEYNEDSDEEY
jgi:hypothetical protein